MAGGFRPFADISGHPWNGKVRTFKVSSAHATLLAIGDLVAITGVADTVTGYPYVDAATATNLITGVITGFALDNARVADLDLKGLPALTAGTVQVMTDTDILMYAEISNGSIAATDVGANADIVATAATSSGNLVNSNMTINAAAFTAATAQVRIVALTELNGAASVGSGVTVICRINESTETGTVGVH